ncbi:MULTISPECIES: DUF3509 domain-containing protein [Pseudomonas]|uniref:DUF3509 domain-containing protein n=1 Tax=Pseudomonas kuykendallii TaxID=1007099 RepID=A0A1H2XER8_9PSED|nr:MULTISPECIES: DUF3509 domain-containing protein [Pseudomonas]MCQ4273549.1 DUF3509 domain-containing protein [Pseudomonas kuykendallii]SDW91208.1 Protein of unknown function [Pseudomonas kuykendallii]
MESPFQMISDVFQADYYVNFSIERLDGSVLLTLSNDDGVTVKRFISADQWRNREKLERFIMSVQLGLAIENGEASPALLASMAQGAHSTSSASQARN